MQKYPPFIKYFSSNFQVIGILYGFVLYRACMHDMRFFFDNTLDKYQCVKINDLKSIETII